MWYMYDMICDIRCNYIMSVDKKCEFCNDNFKNILINYKWKEKKNDVLINDNLKNIYKIE